MKTAFYGYYSPTQDQYERIWKDALIVLDANVLLNLYRLPATARDELISVLEILKDRLWIPHQVALEFQRNRLTVISTERKSTEHALSSTNELVNEVKKKVDALQIDKQGLGIDTIPLLSALESANDQLRIAITATQTAQLDISSIDSVRARLDDLLLNRVGSGPSNQDELDQLISGGQERFREKIPPGFADAEKDKNPNEAHFSFDHIKYPRKFGDLILWRQIIDHVNKEQIKVVLLITADRKEDWWWREQGKTIGPHPELMREIKRKGSVDLFWMYSSVQFVEHANKYTGAKVSSESVAEIQQIALSSPLDQQDDLEQLSFHNKFDENERRHRLIWSRSKYHSLIEHSVHRWLSQFGDKVEFSGDSFPDFLVRKGADVHGYEVVTIQSWGAILGSTVRNGAHRGYVEMQENRISAFSLIVIISEEEFLELTDEKMFAVRNKLSLALKKYSIDSIIIGGVIDGAFEIFLEEINL